MFTLKEKVENLKTQFLKNAESFTKEEFIDLFSILRPQCDIDDEAITNIFVTSKKTEQGKIPRTEVERILDFVLETEEPEVVGDGSKTPNARVDDLLKMGRSSSHQPERIQNTESNIQKKALVEYLSNFDINKVSEIKHIFSICEADKGYAKLEEIRNFINEVKQLTSTPEEIMAIFTLMKEGQSDFVTKETFAKKMSELERAILAGYVNEESQFDRTNLGAESFMFSEALSESYMNDNERTFNQGQGSANNKENSSDHNSMEQELDWIIQRTNLVLDAAQKKTKPKDIASMLSEVTNFSNQFQRKFKQYTSAFKESQAELSNLKKIEEFLRIRVNNLEVDLKHQKDFLNDLQNENESLCTTIAALEHKINLNEHAQASFDEKNNEIVRLERKVRETENKKDEIVEQMRDLESKHKMLLQNYQEIQLLLQNANKDSEITDHDTDTSGQAKYLNEIDSLKVELKLALARNDDFEKEKERFRSITNELKEQLSNTKEFVDTLRLEKNDLQQKLEKLQKELEAIQGHEAEKIPVFTQSFGKVSAMRESLSRLFRTAPTVPLKLPNANTGAQQVEMVKSQEIEREKDEIGIEMTSSMVFKPLNQNPQNEIDMQLFKTQIIPYPLQEKPLSPGLIDLEFEKKGEVAESPPKKEHKQEVFVPKQKTLVSTEINTDLIKKEPEQKSKIVMPTMPSVLDLKNLDQDYLDLMNKSQIIEMLRKHGEDVSYGVCFSDYIYRITSKNQRKYRILLITSEAFYCLNYNKKNYQFKRKISYSNVSKISISEESAGLFAIHVPQEYDYVIDSYKRLNIILFIQTLARFKNLKPIPISYKKTVSIRDRGKTITKEINELKKEILNPELQSTYKSTHKFGDLFYLSKGIFNSWKKYFFVLTDVGLVCFKKEGSKKPLDFIPLVGYNIIDNNEKKDNKFIFKIKFPHSNFEVTLGASSELEKRGWINTIKDVQQNTENKENKPNNSKIN